MTSSKLGDWGAGGQASLEIDDFEDDVDDHSLPPRKECDRCGEDFPCWWHFLDEESDTVDRERIEEGRRRQGVSR